MRSIRWAISAIALFLSASIDAAPSVTLVAPAAPTRYIAPAAIDLVANPTVDAGRSIERVEFLADGDIIGVATQAPYTFSWTNVAPGNYALRARVFDSQGRRDASPVVRVRVRDNKAPHVRILTPDNRETFPAPASIAVSLFANDRDDNLTNVELFASGTSLATFTAAPFEFNWTNVAPGTYALTAVATDDLGLTTTSRTKTITVTGSPPNVPPTVSLTSPTDNASFQAPAAIPLTATAADADGTVARVDFFFGSTLIATRTETPYSITWTNVPEGAYALTALATDNTGASAGSSAVNVTVTRRELKAYFIHVDHLNTPRLIADEQQRVVWRWDQQEPFGDSVPDENPSGLGTFEFPGRLPGQYFDKETNLHYNYFRDFDPALGRLIESDPLGIQAGINTYLYAWDPLLQIDPEGLMGQGSGANTWKAVPRPTIMCGSGYKFGDQVKTMGINVTFAPACQAHDACYDTCYRSKVGCDIQFLGDLIAICASARLGTVNSLICRQQADSYYAAVLLGGQKAYNSAQSCKGCNL
jgi:RHS repeat-associated protein